MNESASTRCLLYADVANGVRLAAKLGDDEAGYAVERCLKRMARSAEAYSARKLDIRADALVARFNDADSALLAAREMRDRVRTLPPLSGIKLVLRAGVVLASEGEDDNDTEQIAAKLVEQSNPDSIVASEVLCARLSNAMLRLLGKPVPVVQAPPVAAPPVPVAVPLPAPVVAPEPVAAVVITPPPAPVVKPVPVAPPVVAIDDGLQNAQQLQKQLRVSYRGQSWVIDAAHPTLLFGRETGNDIVVSDPRVSRQHARIELRNGQFYLADSSTNGTYLLEEGNPEHCVKRDELALAEKGHIGCGFSVGDNMLDAVAFAVD